MECEQFMRSTLVVMMECMDAYGDGDQHDASCACYIVFVSWENGHVMRAPVGMSTISGVRLEFALSLEF